MSIINVLDPYVSNQIAAGEVVERPASAVKELIENSLDAGATSITVEIIDGGTTMIRVTDNGIGMDASDAETAFLRHATSKIHDSEDLNSIHTLGFRGEALAAIASVSKVSMWTRIATGSFGTKVELEAGELLSSEPFGAPNGTSITVNDLFYNTPARKKFLKKPFVESGYVQEVVLRSILSRPDVSFRFVSDKKQVFFSSGDGSLENAIYAVYGKTVRENLMHISGSFSNGSFNGFIGDVSLVRSNRKREHININNRCVNCPAISYAIEESYNTLLMLHKFPFFVISIDMDYHSIDVNVHPSKLEVRIQNETEIAQVITASCVRVLSKQENPFSRICKNDSELFAPVVSGISSKKSEKPADSEPGYRPASIMFKPDTTLSSKPAPASAVSLSKDSARIKSSFRGEELRTPKQVQFDTSIPYDSVQTPSTTALHQDSNDNTVLADEPADYRYIGVFLNTYLLIEMKNSLYVIDQHAAHERLLFDAFSAQIEKAAVLSQPLLIPSVETVSIEEMSCFLENKDILHSIGFDAEAFGPTAISMRAVPMILGETRTGAFLHDSLEYLMHNKTNTSKTDVIRLDIATKACKAAVKAGDPLSDSEIMSLLRMIESYDGPLTCPHGRPIYYRITSYQMEKWFKRSV